jgi:hypothetical protein
LVSIKNAYLNYLRFSPWHSFNANPNYLCSIGVESTPSMEHPHIFDLANPLHESFVHNLFTYAAAWGEHAGSLVVP